MGPAMTLQDKTVIERVKAMCEELRNARMMVNYGHGCVGDEPDPLHEAAAALIEELVAAPVEDEGAVERLRGEVMAVHDALGHLEDFEVREPDLHLTRSD